MKPINSLISALALLAAAQGIVHAEPDSDAMSLRFVQHAPAGSTDLFRESTGKGVGRIPYRLPAGTTDALRYRNVPRVSGAIQEVHGAPLGSTDRVRQLAGMSYV